MNRKLIAMFGLIVAMLVVVTIMQSIQLNKLPRLEEQIDKLEVENQELDQENQVLVDEVILSEEAYKSLQHQLEMTESEYTKQIEELQQRIKELEEELSKSVFKEVATVGDSFEVTWYNYNSGATFTGVPPEDGVTVAVDPNVIPLGSWVKLEFPDGRKLVRKAQDTGGAVNGNIIDVYSTKSTNTLLQRGRSHGVEVTLLKKL